MEALLSSCSPLYSVRTIAPMPLLPRFSVAVPTPGYPVLKTTHRHAQRCPLSDSKSNQFIMMKINHSHVFVEETHN